MTVIILEDEAITAEELRHYVRDVDPFKTVEAVTYLNSGVKAGERVVTQNQLLIYSALGS